MRSTVLAFIILLTVAWQGQAAPDYGNLPLSFEANTGQTDSKVQFLSRGRGYGLFLTADEAVLSLTNGNIRSPKSAVLRMRLAGPQREGRVEGMEPLGKRHYLRGSDPSNWQTDIPAFKKVRYHGVYPGIDLVYYGNRRQLEYDFVVAPGADPARIALALSGIDSVAIDAEGNLRAYAGPDQVQIKLIFNTFKSEVAYLEPVTGVDLA